MVLYAVFSRELQCTAIQKLLYIHCGYQRMIHELNTINEQKVTLLMKPTIVITTALYSSNSQASTLSKNIFRVMSQSTPNNQHRSRGHIFSTAFVVVEGLTNAVTVVTILVHLKEN